ncbi:CIC11C00000001687 [Sungouiella intermedia]|uniref:CIC11C00000001687 n=1 Tax=Sungouiella intermedia TaxID=45354 RepID=A0A1L0G5W4_9ASCO|nr:CIC11C00000001687 [[Candida] intermedia]
MFSLRLIRSLSTFSKTEIENARKWLDASNLASIPRHLFTISYSRSSGPGGQKVNKTSSKATISLEPDQWLNPQFCFWMPAPVLDQIKQSTIRYQTKNGGILVQSDGSRSRELNTDECFRKLLQDIKDNVYFAEEVSEQDKKKWEDLAMEQKEKRMFHKKRQSDKKKLRLKQFDI